MTATRALVSSVVLIGLSAVLAAQAPALDLKLGLWENTIVMNLGGAPPMDTSKLPPEAAQMAAAMKELMGDRTITDKSCVTKEDLAKDSFMLPEESGMTCKRTIMSNTATAYVADVHCTGNGETKGQISIQTTAGGTAFTGSMKMVTTAQGRTVNSTMKMSGKYLGSDCGSVK